MDERWKQERELHRGLLEKIQKFFNCNGSAIMDPVAQAALNDLSEYFFAHPWVHKVDMTNIIMFPTKR